MNPTPTRQPLQRALHPAEDTNPDELIGEPVEGDVDLSGLQPEDDGLGDPDAADDDPEGLDA